MIREKKHFKNLCEMMDDEGTYDGDHFPIYVSQVTILYTLNFYCALRRLHFSKIKEAGGGGKNGRKEKKKC